MNAEASIARGAHVAQRVADNDSAHSAESNACDVNGSKSQVASTLRAKDGCAAVRAELACGKVVNGMFFEKSTALRPGQTVGFAVDHVLHEERTPAGQDLLVFKSKNHGAVMVLDGAVQLAEFDEFAYHEMMACVPLAVRPESAPPARRALVVGGGDAGVIRELLRAGPSLEVIDLVEIDARVVDVARDGMIPSLDAARVLSDPCVRLHLGRDACEYVRDYTGEKYDIVVSDSTDPEGPGASLFSSEFFGNVRRIMCPRAGVFCAMGESMWLHAKMIRSLLGTLRHHFAQAEYASFSVPTYPGGSMGLLVAGTSEDCVPSVAKSKVDGHRFYTRQLHEASFVLPLFAQKALSS